MISFIIDVLGCRTPQGVRGLKSPFYQDKEDEDETSHPARGAWIEIRKVEH